LIDNDVNALAIDWKGNKWFGTTNGVSFLGDLATLETYVRSTDKHVPEKTYLLQNYPNPFNPETTIRFHVPKRSHVKLLIFNVNGQLIRTLIDEDKQPGSYEVLWNGENETETTVASGVYLCVLGVNNEIDVRKMILVR